MGGRRAEEEWIMESWGIRRNELLRDDSQTAQAPLRAWCPERALLWAALSREDAPRLATLRNAAQLSAPRAPGNCGATGERERPESVAFLRERDGGNAATRTSHQISVGLRNIGAIDDARGAVAFILAVACPRPRSAAATLSRDLTRTAPASVGSAFRAPKHAARHVQ